jgi:hypothetical protein
MDSECDRPAMLIAKAARSADAPVGEYPGPGVIAASGKTINGAFPKSFVAAIAQHRFAEGRVSKAIESLDLVARTGVTRSGRLYELIGEPGSDPDADYVWAMWARANGVTRARTRRRNYSRGNDPERPRGCTKRPDILGYIRIARSERHSRQGTVCTQIAHGFQFVRLGKCPFSGNSPYEKWMVAKGGIEPPTHGFSVAVTLEIMVANSKIRKRFFAGRCAALPGPDPFRTCSQKKRIFTRATPTKTSGCRNFQLNVPRTSQLGVPPTLLLLGWRRKPHPDVAQRRPKVTHSGAADGVGIALPRNCPRGDRIIPAGQHHLLITLPNNSHCLPLNRCNCTDLNGA